VRRGTARLGGGTLELSGSAPFVGRDLGRLTGRFIARGVNLPLGEGIRLALDADLEGIYAPSATGERSLPKVTGTVAVLSAEYTRPMAVTADLAALTGRGKKTEVDAYDPTRDNVELDVLVISKGPLRVRNDLVDAELRIDPAGLRVSGTDQRFGAVGSVQLNPGGQLRLRRNEFEIRQGIVRFNDPTRIAPQVDVTATTEYRRYGAPSTESSAAATTTSATSSATMGGLWRINLHAYGEPENLRVDLTSDPSLAQDDIFLLLTVGLTRAELDQTRSAGVGSSVALEALGTLSGAGEAVTEAVPVIDDFRFGSAYSSRTGRTEPTVTIGKRLSERIRASVTTSLAGSSEVRSNVEWRVSQRVSVEGSYDNVEDIGSPVVGNLGGDVRWRLEFE
jgi:translocation and assembly module TamB